MQIRKNKIASNATNQLIHSPLPFVIDHFGALTREFYKSKKLRRSLVKEIARGQRNEKA